MSKPRQERLETDPVGQPRAQGLLATELTRLVGVWGRPDGLEGGTRESAVFGLAFLAKKPWLAIARVTRDGNVLSGGIRFVSTADRLEVGACRPLDVPPHTPAPGCFDLDVDADDRILAAMTDMTVRVFDGSTGEETKRFELAAELVRYCGPRHFASVVTGLSSYPSPYSRAGLRKGPTRLSIHDRETGASVADLQFEGTWISGFCVRADGERIVLVIGRKLRVIDRECRTIWEKALEYGVTTTAGPAVFDPTGRIAVAMWGSGFRLYDGETGEVAGDFTGSGSLELPTFSHDGRLLAHFQGGRNVAIADARTGTRLRSVEGFGECVMVFSPDDSLLATGNYQGRVRIYDSATLAILAAAPGLARGFGLDESRVAAGLLSENTIVLTDHEGVVQETLPRVWKERSRILGITAQGVVVRDSSSGPVVVASAATEEILVDRFQGAAMVSAGRLVVSGYADATVFSPDGRSKVELTGAHRDEFTSEGETEHHEVSALAVSPDGTLAATGSSDSTVGIWSLPGGKLVHHLHVLRDGYVRMRAFALSFSRDGDLLFAVVNGAGIYAWDVATGKVRYTLENRNDKGLVEIPPAVALDRRLVAFALSDAVLLCNPDDGRELDRLHLGDAPDALAFSGPHLFVLTSRRLLLRFALAD